jgi:hypothetical protein
VAPPKRRRIESDGAVVGAGGAGVGGSSGVVGGSGGSGGNGGAGGPNRWSAVEMTALKDGVDRHGRGIIEKKHSTLNLHLLHLLHLLILLTLLLLLFLTLKLPRRSRSDVSSSACSQ